MHTKTRTKVQKKMRKVMHEFKRGTLKMGRSAKKVSDRAQAIAIGLSQARRSGTHIPRRNHR